jgi:hypothetical protein
MYVVKYQRILHQDMELLENTNLRMVLVETVEYAHKQEYHQSLSTNLTPLINLFPLVWMFLPQKRQQNGERKDKIKKIIKGKMHMTLHMSLLGQHLRKTLTGIPET